MLRDGSTKYFEYLTNKIKEKATPEELAKIEEAQAKQEKAQIEQNKKLCKSEADKLWPLIEDFKDAADEEIL